MMKRYSLLALFFCLVHPLYASVQGEVRHAGKLYKQKKYGQAQTAYAQVLQQNPDNTEAAIGLGASSYYLKDYAAAQHAFKRAAKQDDKRAQDAQFNLGNAYYRAGQKQQAIAAYRQVLENNPADKEALHNLQLILNEPPQAENKQNQNDKNQNDKSNNQDKSGGSNGQGGNDEQPDAQQQPDGSQEQQTADRVLQMAKETEAKQTHSGSPMQENNIEKDW